MPNHGICNVKAPRKTSGSLISVKFGQETERNDGNRYLLYIIHTIQVAHIGRLNNELVSEKESLRKELERAKREPQAMRKKRILSEKVRYHIIPPPPSLHASSTTDTVQWRS